MKLKTLALAAAVMLASAVPAAAESMCVEPIAPAAVDGNTVTKAQIEAALTDVKTFLKQSDDYQGCLLKELNDAKAAALKDKKDVDPALLASTASKVQANQALKEKVGAEFNASVHDFNVKHPG